MSANQPRGKFENLWTLCESSWASFKHDMVIFPYLLGHKWRLFISALPLLQEEVKAEIEKAHQTMKLLLEHGCLMVDFQQGIFFPLIRCSETLMHYHHQTGLPKKEKATAKISCFQGCTLIVCAEKLILFTSFSQSLSLVHHILRLVHAGFLFPRYPT